MLKSDIRTKLKAHRQALTLSQIKQNSQKICDAIRASTTYQDARHVALYYPFQNEVNLLGLLDDDKNFYVPSIQGKTMQFQKLTESLTIKTHAFGMKQPDFRPQMKSSDIGLYLMPLLGFDLSGNRLGMGGGFYDRYFSNAPTGVRAGVAHHCQLWPQLPADPWDVKLHHIFTELGHHESTGIKETGR